MTKEEYAIQNKELRKAAIRAWKAVTILVREEPHPTVISDGSGSDSGGTLKEITGWLFHRRHGDGSERNRTSN